MMEDTVWRADYENLLKERDALRAEVERERGWAEIVWMIRDHLAALGCCCEGHKKGDSAPMFYPEWISCVVRKYSSEQLRTALCEACEIIEQVDWVPTEDDDYRCSWCGWEQEGHAPDCRAAAFLEKWGKGDD